MAQVRLILGVGINDADYVVTGKINNKQVICPFYKKWKSMITRCYSLKYQKDKPTYIDCTVCDEWLIFSNFKKWMETQDWQGKQLDKDLLIQGNKVYSPDACLFITSQINSLLVNCLKPANLLPQGVSWNEERKKYEARCSFNGRKKHLGRYNTLKGADTAYRLFKSKVIKDAAITQSQPLQRALLNYANDLLRGNYGTR